MGVNSWCRWEFILLLVPRWNEDGSEDRVRSDEEDLMEDSLEGLDDIVIMSEGYGRIDEDESMNENEEGVMDEGGKSITGDAAMEEEEDSTDESEDFNELGNGDDEEDSMDEGEEFDEVDDQDDECELEEVMVSEQHSQ